MWNKPETLGYRFALFYYSLESKQQIFAEHFVLHGPSLLPNSPKNYHQPTGNQLGNKPHMVASWFADRSLDQCDWGLRYSCVMGYSLVYFMLHIHEFV